MISNLLRYIEICIIICTTTHTCKTLYPSTTCVQKGKGGKGSKKAPPRKEDTIETLPEGTDTSFPTEVNPETKTTDGRKFTLKIASWNINGIRAWYDVSVWIIDTVNSFMYSVCVLLTYRCFCYVWSLFLEAIELTF